MNMISTGSFLTGTDASKEQDTLAGKFAAVWEKKNAKAARAGGVSLMALTLAACGSSSDDTAADAGAATDADAATDDAATDTTTTALTALQAEVADLVLSRVTGEDNVEAATLAEASNATALEVTATTTAPTTELATQEMLGDAAEQVFAAVENEVAGVTAQYTNLDGGAAFVGGDGDANFLMLVDALSATTAAGKTAITTATDAADALITASLTTANNAVLTTTQTIGASLTAAQSSDLAAFTGAMSGMAANSANQKTNVDTTAATAAELAAGTEAIASQAVAAVLAATGITSTAANTAAATEVTVAWINANLTPIAHNDAATGMTAGDLVYDGNSGNFIGAASTTIAANTAAAIVTAAASATTMADLMAAAADALDGAAVGAIDITAGGAAGTHGAALEAINAAVAGGDGSIGGSAAEVIAVMGASYTATELAAIKADFDAVLAAYDDVVAAQTAVDAIDTSATVIELQNDGTTITMATGATAAATANDDIFGYVTDLDNSVTIGSAAQAFGANGDDSLVIAGEYTFVTITEAQSDAIATETLGDASALEIFVYQDATSGNATLYVERVAGEGNVEGTTMSTITLVDTAFADLGQAVADGVTVLTSAEAVVA